MLELHTSDFEIILGIRQKNMITDRLADIAHRHKTNVAARSLEELPREARRAAIADRMGL